MYYAVQGLTLGILVLAANTSYQGFPRLTAVLARDGYAPRQFVNLGDRLVLSNGILVLAGIAALLIWVFHADVDSLIHLYVIGVFTAFTLSQAGMVRHWARTEEPGWRGRAAINGLGAAATGIVTLLVVQTKFLEGAWLVTVAIPVLIGLLLVVHRHYRTVGRRLRASTSAVPRGRVASNEVVVVATGLDRAATLAAWYAREIQSSSVRAVHAGGTPHPGWWRLAGVPLEELDMRHGRVDAVLDRIWALPHGDGRFVTVVVPEQFEHRSLFEAVVRRRTAFSLKLRLLREPGVVVTDVPVVGAFELPAPAERRLVGRVLVSGVQAASLRALDYAASLGLPDTKAVFFAFDAAEAERIRADWERAAPPVPLEIVEAPYRDLGEPLLDHLRDLTADPNVLVSVVMPELVFSGWRALLHNQRALYVKRLLLFEPRVILSSVPYQLV
jgi:hypothetical protein